MLDPTTAARHARVRTALRRELGDRLSMGDVGWVEYRPDVYHLGDEEPLPAAGEVGVTRDGRRKVTRDGGVWAVDARERYRDHDDIFAVDPDSFEVESVGPAMLEPMRAMYDARHRECFACPWHYGTLVTRATIEFGWEPLLLAAGLEPDRFGAYLARFAAASLAVVQGWCEVPGTELIAIHDDIAGTRGVCFRPEWYRRYVFPWYERLFDTVHRAGRQVLYVSDGDYREVLPDLLALGPDGLYVESSSIPPAEFLPCVGPDKLFLIKTCNRVMDFGTPEDVRRELWTLRELHRGYPAILLYPGGGRPAPGCREAFERWYGEYLVYG
ncbi:MAG: hypothetical protein HYU66_09440 [Armatimonadetes bacterium]|nr:hypothetical protein [Armatimonadota bacterium]